MELEVLWEDPDVVVVVALVEQTEGLAVEFAVAVVAVGEACTFAAAASAFEAVVVAVGIEDGWVGAFVVVVVEVANETVGERLDLD